MQTTTPHWRTSSYTGTENCLEVADNNPDKVMIRDTKAPEHGYLSLQPPAWTALLEHVRKI
ncbi:DUF397 domain-containing protein [Streptomyces sp. NPDC051214]|uniref:DUF397 domain-containing protein n=1 Tax=Streptomyces sp. NPDC051214 TaxID=3155282 RepID=UPI0034492B24